MPMKIGIIGTESSHVDHIIDFLNVQQARPSCRVVALAGGDEGRNSQLARLGAIDIVTESSEDLLRFADALIVTTRHGGCHRVQAAPFLAEGRPVLIDKPLACSVADAQEIFATATAHSALVTSYSTLRHLPVTKQLVSELPSLGPLRSVVTTGPADENSPYGGIFYYGIHPADIALLLAPGDIGQVRADRVGESIVADAKVGQARVTVNLVQPGPNGPVPFHALAVGQSGVATSELRPAGNYVAHGLNAFLDMATGKTPPLSALDMLRPISFLEAIRDALLPSGGARPLT
jgi:predicted dehydrogenase